MDQLQNACVVKVINELEELEDKTEPAAEITMVILEIARSILDAPSKEISRNTKMAKLNKIHQYKLNMSNIFLIRDNQTVTFQSHVCDEVLDFQNLETPTYQ